MFMELKVSVREIERTYSQQQVFDVMSTPLKDMRRIEKSICCIEGVIRIEISTTNAILFTNDISIGPYEEIVYLSRIHQLEETLKKGKYTKWMP